MSRYVSPVETITDLNGAPMVGAKLVFYETGTATLKTIYSDSGLSVPLANPVTAVSSGAGAIYPDIYLDGIYKVVQQDDTGTAGVADGAVLWTRDPVGAIATGNFETWLNDSTYNIPEVVYASDDNYYISLVDDNQGNEPSVSPSQWQLIPVKDMARVTNPVLNGDVSGTAFLDEDDMSSDSETKLASQQSIKAYVDANSVTDQAYTDTQVAALVKSHGGIVASTGTMTSQSGGLTSSKTGTGSYRITHNLGHSTYSALTDADTSTAIVTQVIVSTTTYFDVTTRVLSTTDLSDFAFTFGIIEW